MTNKILKAIFHSIEQSNGASYNLWTQEINPTTGYMVALEFMERNYRMPESPVQLSDILNAYATGRQVWAKLNEEPYNKFIGFWVHNGRLVVDLSENITDRTEALAVGQDRNQIAVYDCLNKVDINIPAISDYDER